MHPGSTSRIASTAAWESSQQRKERPRRQYARVVVRASTLTKRVQPCATIVREENSPLRWGHITRWNARSATLAHTPRRWGHRRLTPAPPVSRGSIPLLWVRYPSPLAHHALPESTETLKGRQEKTLVKIVPRANILRRREAVRRRTACYAAWASTLQHREPPPWKRAKHAWLGHMDRRRDP